MPQSSKTLHWLIASFSLPILIAFGLYFSHYQPSTTNKGHLVSPPEHTTFLQKGTFIGTTPKKQSWKIIYLEPNKCSFACHNDIKRLEHLWALMGANQERVDPIVLSQRTKKTAPVHHLHYKGKPPEINRATQKVPDAFVFIVDPLDNLLMAYRSPSWAKDLLVDLKKLLHVSQIG